ncbi:hypothetical protein [Paenibacillus sp. YYML68]|uniref:hypothetical protein n=1 Tax=Paenibacillus sp. YYML68 TaxID=2909250 RepID=UPI002490CA76|nr:hypothetical protein [Paenibacillus sp. YYML68]
MPESLFQIALIIIIVRSVYMMFSLSQRPKKQWLEIAYSAAVAVAAAAFLLAS